MVNIPPKFDKKFTVIDVSRWQGQNYDWGLVGQYANRVIIKSSQGNRWSDPEMHQNIVGATEAGLRIEVYHYLEAMSPVAEQINLAYNRVSEYLLLGNRIIKRLWVDVEWLPHYKILNADDVVRFRLGLEDKTGLPVGIYTSINYLNRLIGDKKLVMTGDPDMWMAWYPHTNIVKLNQNPDTPTINMSRIRPDWFIRDPVLWQVGSTYRVPGVNGGRTNVDLNINLEVLNE